MGRPIAVDSVILIYLFEKNLRYIEEVRGLFRFIADGTERAVFASIGLIEVLTGPKRIGDEKLAFIYKEMIAHFPNLAVISLNDEIIELASSLRAKYKLATPDAIHLATAINTGARVFVTNDKGLRKVKEIKVRTLA